jgi:hypothetical protein
MKYLLILLLLPLNMLAQTFTYSGYIYNTNGSGASNVPVKLYARTSNVAAVVQNSEQFGVSNGSAWLTKNTYSGTPNNSTTYNYSITNAFTITTSAGVATIAPFTSNIPANRNRGTSVLFSSLNSDEGSVIITFPSGFTPSFLGTTYSSGHINANSWFTFGTNSSSGYSGTASNPNAPTLHIGSVSNSTTDNNMSYTSTESYTDPYWGDVFRVRYEGNSNYSQQGINTIYDLYFIKNQPNTQLVVWRQFTTDGSSTSVSGSPPGPWTLNTTSITNSNGYYSFNTSLNVSSYEFYIQIDVPSPISNLSNNDITNTLKIVNGVTSLNSSHYYLHDVNGDGKITISDAYYIGARKQGRFGNWINSFNARLFTPAEYNIIRSNNSNLKLTYPGVSSITISNPTNGGSSNYYIISPGYSGNTTF